jgi:hypothetical protein
MECKEGRRGHTNSSRSPLLNSARPAVRSAHAKSHASSTSTLLP